MMQIGTKTEIQMLNGVEFKRTSPHDEAGFPGEVQISSSYFVSPDNEIVMIWEARMPDEQEGMRTPINITNHTYWNLSGDFKHKTIADHSLQINSHQILEFNDVQIPTG